ncbi:MAG: cobalamin B12-binding domain-containing protein [Candidatus Omnitrophica bacterium]|nr:cobalamin B12-binding domain-containing protein [Candidatus Omnitrophota bacterium]
MKIALVSPRLETNIYHQPVVGLAYLKSYLREKGIKDVSIFDAFKSSDKAIRDFFIKENPDIIGISCLTLYRNNAFRMAEIAKNCLPGVTIIMGGIHATLMAEEIMKRYSFVDYIVMGEGELTFYELVESINKKNPAREVCGIAGREGEKIFKTQKRAAIQDLDILPFPEYIELNHEDMFGVKAALAISSRGCGHACNYCSTTRYWGRWRGRSPKNVVDEMEFLEKEKGVRYIVYEDDSFTMDFERTEAICNERLKRKLQIPWRCNTRADRITKYLCDMMAKAGCVHIGYGIETGSPTILKNINKQMTTEQIKNAFKWTKESGMATKAFFMVGNIGETRKTINETKELIEEIKPDKFVVSQYVYIFPFTPLYEHAKKHGLIDDSFWLGERTVMPYTLENSIEQMSGWQMEIIKTCFRHKPKWEYYKYAFEMAKTLPKKDIVRAGINFLKSQIKQAR